MAERFDFSGWATRNNLKCSDGRIIRRDAFKDNDCDVVPLIWQHDHSSPANVFGHALLENRNEGVYAFCVLNDCDYGRAAMAGVQHGDIDALSIYANQLTQNGSDVIHGVIREVSLVMHGANPGAYIDNIITHSDGSEAYGETGFIYNDEMIDNETPYYLCHAADGSYFINNEGVDEEMYDDYEELEHADDEKTVKDVFDSMTEEQKMVVYFMIGEAVKNAKPEKKTKESDEEDEETMKHNVFDNSVNYTAMNTTDANALMHGEELRAEESAIFEEAAKKQGSLRDTVLAHAGEYGITDIDWLFPDAKTLTNEPDFISRNMDWVTVFLNGVKRSPFSRIKTIFADITADAARAKGYTKGHKKLEEVFSLLKRITSPTTIYKKQKLDRQDVVDITSFDVVAYIRREMRIMLNEEIAQACLIGDLRDPVQQADDKVDEQCIRPIYSDDSLFSIRVSVTVGANDDYEAKAKNLIKSVIRGRKDYKGSGNPIFFTTEDVLADLMLVEDGIGRRLYRTKQELADALMVRDIVTVEKMANITRTVTPQGGTATTYTLAGIIVNPIDYVIGADKGGEINTFDDFDIDYNQMKYLMETHCSGCLVKPYSAMVIEFVPAAA